MWAKLNAKHKEQLDGGETPDRNEEYFLYQTLIGVWPLEGESCDKLVERLQVYLVKATREAMVHTRWTRPNQPHEEALQRFVARILSPAAEDFLREFRPFQREISYYGMVNSLSQMVLKIVAPGVPDFYQGSELWDLRLVDPDNRAPVDFERRIASLRQLVQDEAKNPAALIRSLVEQWHDGRIKLFLLQKAIRFRRENAFLLQEGDFLPLETRGECRQNVVCFIRRQNGQQILVAVQRWLSRVASSTDHGKPDWHNTEVLLPEKSSHRWQSILCGHEVTIHENVRTQSEGSLGIADLFAHFPVALFCSVV